MPPKPSRAGRARRAPRGAAGAVHRALGDGLVDSRDPARPRPLDPGVDRRLAHRRRGRPTPPRGPLLRLPVGDRLAAVAVRPLDGLRGRPPSRRRRRRAARRADADDRDRASPVATPASRCSPGSPTSASRVDYWGVTLKADIPDDDAERRVVGRRSTPEPTGTSARPGRCSASTFVGHPGLRHMYLPGCLRGQSDAQGLPAARPAGQAVAGHRRRRAHAGRTTSPPPTGPADDGR